MDRDKTTMVVYGLVARFYKEEEVSGQLQLSKVRIRSIHNEDVYVYTDRITRERMKKELIKNGKDNIMYKFFLTPKVKYLTSVNPITYLLVCGYKSLSKI